MIEYDGLLGKGFSKKEAKRTIEIIKGAKQKRSLKIKFLDSIIYWVLLIIAIIGNMVISIVLIPFLLAFKEIPLYFTIAILAAMFGFLFDILIKDIDSLENRHHIVAWAFIPALAVINTYYMVSFANHVTLTLELPFALHSPLLISVTYVSAFMLPYLAHNLIKSPSKHVRNFLPVYNW